MRQTSERLKSSFSLRSRCARAYLRYCDYLIASGPMEDSLDRKKTRKSKYLWFRSPKKSNTSGPRGVLHLIHISRGLINGDEIRGQSESRHPHICAPF